MEIKHPFLKVSDMARIFVYIQIYFLFIPVHFSQAYGATESVGEDLAFLAQEGEVVESATKYPQLVRNAPASVTVITHDEISRYGWRTLADLLQSVRGFYVTNDKNYSYLGVQGFQRGGDYNSRILALLNGHTLNEDVYQQFFMGNDSGIDLDIVDRVEIVRGAGSALYGTNAVFAVVNIITKDGKDINGFRSSMEVGSGGANKGILTYGKTQPNGWDIIFNASYFKSIGRDLSFPDYNNGNPANNGGITHNDGEYAYNLFYRAKIKDLTIQLAGNDREKQIPTGSYGAVFNDPREETFDGRYQAEVKYDHQVSEKYGFMIRIYDDWYRYRGYYPITGYPADTVNSDYSLGQYYGGEIQLRRDFAHWNKLIIGSEYQKHSVLLQNYDLPSFSCIGTGSPSPCLDTAINFDLFSLYLEDEIRPFDNLALTLGVRRDRYINYSDLFSDKMTPRIALVYSPLPKTVLKLIYGEAFRAPSSYELYYHAATNIDPGHASPETISNFEAVWEQTLDAHYNTSLFLFQYTANDLIDLSADATPGHFQYQNISQVEGHGVEAEIKGRWADGTAVYLNATFQETVNTTTGVELSNSPRVLAKSGLILPITEYKTYFSVEEQYVGERDTLSDATGA
ncbi:MAG TPA: TonB-dependent receptor, partial [Nitrospiria bacterium]|nr:TonB-dependent receptor [Nitrospiria bacterium]